MAITFDMHVGEGLKQMPKGTTLKRLSSPDAWEAQHGTDSFTGDLWGVVEWVKGLLVMCPCHACGKLKCIKQKQLHEGGPVVWICHACDSPEQSRVIDQEVDGNEYKCSTCSVRPLYVGGAFEFTECEQCIAEDAVRHGVGAEE